MNRAMKLTRRLLTPSFMLLSLAFASSAECAVEFSVPQSVYQQPSTEKYHLSETAYRQLQPIQRNISAERYDDALSALNRLVKRHEKNPYVVSVAMKSAAYIYISQQKYPKAIEWMQQILILSAMSSEELQTIRHDLSQLQLQTEQYQNAITTMQRWLKEATKTQVSAADYQLLAVSQFQLKRYKKAKQSAQKGLKHTKSLMHLIEPLYQLILACDLALKNYTSADKTLSTLVKLNPSRKNYWVQWVGVLDLLEKPDQALVIFELMDKRKMLKNEQEKIQFVQRLTQQDNAFKAGRKMHEYIQQGEIKNSTENQLLLASAWERSGESNAAIVLLAPLKNNSVALSQLARIYANKHQWQPLVELLESTLKRPVNNINESIYVQLGYGYVQLKDVNQAVKIFDLLANTQSVTAETRKTATQWLKYLEQQ